MLQRSSCKKITTKQGLDSLFRTEEFKEFHTNYAGILHKSD